MSIGFFTDFIRENPNYDLDCAIGFVMDDFPSDFADAWGVNAEFAPEDLDADTWQECKRLQQMAERLAAAASELVRPKRLPDKVLSMPAVLEAEAEAEEENVNEILKLLDQLRDDGVLSKDQYDEWYWRFQLPSQQGARGKQAFFETCMQLHAARMFMDWPGPVAHRMLRLLNFLMRVENIRTQQYLSRVAECYVRSMRAEFAVMSRAVVQAALEDILSTEQVREILQLPRAQRVGLGNLISAADRVGILSPEAKEACERVKTAGDDAVHTMPDVAADPDDVLADLAKVVAHLEGRSDASYA